MAKIDPPAAADTLTRADLIEEVTGATGLLRYQAEAVVVTVLESLIEALRDGEKIELRGFGSFGVRHNAFKSHEPAA